MKKLFLFIPVVLLLSACGGSGGGSGASLPMNSQIDSVSYAFGINIAQTLDKIKEDSDNSMELNIDLLNNGIHEGVGGNARLTDQDMQMVMTKFSQEIQKVQQAKQSQAGVAALAAGQVFLAENAAKEGVKTTASGLQYKVIKEGSGASPTTEDKVMVHYTGKLPDGTVFDSSVERGTPATFGVTQVIPGWTEGLQLMNPGAKFEFTIPAALGYGERGSPPKIPSNSVLVFDVEMLEIVK